jgi:hypothetical protein
MIGNPIDIAEMVPKDGVQFLFPACSGSGSTAMSRSEASSEPLSRDRGHTTAQLPPRRDRSLVDMTPAHDAWWLT